MLTERNWKEQLRAMAVYQAGVAQEETLAELNRRTRNQAERVTGAQRTIENDHAAIHFGEGYSVPVLETGSARIAIGAAASRGILLVPAQMKYLHWKQFLVTTNSANMEVLMLERVYRPIEYEGEVVVTVAPDADGDVTVTLDGTARVVAVLAVDDADAAAGKIQVVINALADYTAAVGAPPNEHVVTITRTATDFSPMTLAFDAGTTGATATVAVTPQAIQATLLEPQNRSRISGNLSESLVYLVDDAVDPDDMVIGGATGTRTLDAFWLYGDPAGGVGANARGPAGSDTNLQIELVLDPNEFYLFRVNNLEAAARAFNVWAYWYEERFG